MHTCCAKRNLSTSASSSRYSFCWERTNFWIFDTRGISQTVKDHKGILRDEVISLCEEGRIVEANEIFQRQPSNPYGASALISAFAKQHRDLASAFAIFDVFTQTSPLNRLESKKASFIIVLNSLIAACRICGSTENAINLFETLSDKAKDEGLGEMALLDRTGFHLLAACCGEVGEARLAWRFVEHLTKKGKDEAARLQVGPVDCGQLCKALVAGGCHVAGGVALLDLMDSLGIVPSPQTYTVLFKGCGELAARDSQDAVQYENSCTPEQDARTHQERLSLFFNHHDVCQLWGIRGIEQGVGSHTKNNTRSNWSCCVELRDRRASGPRPP